jgi:hypothetical protein
MSLVRRRSEVAVGLAVLAATAFLYVAVFNRESTLSYSIGYNLYGAERVLEGQVPYRDFHTLYPPATLYVNAALFRWAGVYLLTALAGVLIFKVLTGVMIYYCARSAMPTGWALAAWGLSLVWLRPNGPFKAVPMHYGTLFLAVALWWLIKFEANRSCGNTSGAFLFVLAAGASLGGVALFKHNIGAYALVGSLVLLLLEPDQDRLRFNWSGRERRSYVAGLLGGFAVVVTPVALYFLSQRALGAMIRTLLFGPGEFLVSRLAAGPSPLFAIGFLLMLGAGAGAGYRLRKRPGLSGAIWIALAIGAVAAAALVPQRLVDSLIFYLPVVVIAAGLACAIARRQIPAASRWRILALAVFAAAALMESFPRFAREQAIAAMPFVVILLLALLNHLKPQVDEFAGGAARTRVATAALPLLLAIIAARLLAATYLGEGFRLRSDTPLGIARGRGVYFPQQEAEEITRVVEFIRARVPEGGYFFAHSYAGSAFLFLANRRNPSGAQFWRGVGVSPDEQARTLASLEQNRITIVVTSRGDLNAERYEPMRDVLTNRFHITQTIGDVLILERMVAKVDVDAVR